VLKTGKSSWRSDKKQGGGCMMDFASHMLDLADYLFGPVRAVPGALLRSVYSEGVEDAVYANVEHESGVTGTVMSNWSDESYRRPYNRVEVLGKRGKIVADRQEFRLFLRDADPKGRFPRGWSVKYLPELEEPARFQVRGPEFTHQLDDFVSCMEKSKAHTDCSFADAARTDDVMQMIRAASAGRAEP